MTMTEAEADQRSTELNAQLGAAGKDREYYVPVQADDGSWVVEKRKSKPTLLEFLIDAIPP